MVGPGVKESAKEKRQRVIAGSQFTFESPILSVEALGDHDCMAMKSIHTRVRFF